MKPNFYSNVERRECFNLDHVEHVKTVGEVTSTAVTIRISFVSGKFIEYSNDEAEDFMLKWQSYISG